MNARWSLYSSRNQVHFSKDVQGPDAARVAWNHVLAWLVVPAAVATILVWVTERLGEGAVEAYYEWWPDLARLSEEPSKTMGVSIYEELAGHPVICVKRQEEVKWVQPAEARISPASWKAELVSRLVADGLSLARPAPPTRVTAGLKKVEGEIPNLAPSEVRDFLTAHGTEASKLSEPSLSCLRDPEWVSTLLGFCSEAGRARLDRLPLALMQDGALRTFGASEVCLAPAEIRSLFRDRPSWFLEARLQDKGLVKVAQAGMLVELTPDVVISRLGEFLPEEDGAPWTPQGGAAPSESWLVELYGWLSSLPDLPKRQESLQKYAMIPGDDGNLYRAGFTGTPLLPTGQLTLDRAKALSAFGLRIVADSEALFDGLSLLRRKANDGMVWFTTAEDVIDSLDGEEWPALPSNSPHRAVLLDWLAAGHAMNMLDTKRLEGLYAKVLWPSEDGRVVSAGGQDVFIPEGFVPPAGFSRKTLLQTGVGGRWRSLQQALRVRNLDRATWILECFIPQYGSLAQKPRASALAWLRDEGVRALDGDGEQPKKVREALQKTPLIEDEARTLAAPSMLYHPNAEKALDLLGAVARIPDMKGAYRQDQNRWEYLFDRLGLHKYPRREDLVARVQALVSRSTPENEKDTVEHLLAVFEHLGERLEKSSQDEKNYLGQQLRSIAWIPAMRRASENVALFPLPNRVLLLPAEAHPPGLVHAGASQVAFSTRGTEKGIVRALLEAMTPV